MIKQYWCRFLFAFACAFASVFLVNTVTYAQDSKPAFVISPELKRKIGDANSLQEMAVKYEQCQKDAQTCKTSSEEQGKAFAEALAECHSPCKTYEEWKNGDCRKKPSTATTTPGQKAFASGQPVKIVECTPPSTVKNGVCVCADDTLNPDIGKSKHGDVVAVNPIGRSDGTCVPSFEAVKQTVIRDNKLFHLICRIDDVEIGPKEHEWLKEHGIDPDTRLDPNDPRCERTWQHLEWLIGYLNELAKQPESVRTNLVNTPSVGDHLGGLADLKLEITKLKKRVSILEQTGVHFELLGTGFYNWRPENGVQDTYGGMFGPNMVYMLTPRDGLMVGGRLGYGKQPKTQEVMWRVTLEWIHHLNRTNDVESSTKTTELVEEETKVDGVSTQSSASVSGSAKVSSDTLYSFRLGGYAEGGIPKQNYQNENQYGFTTGLQISKGMFLFDAGFSIGGGPVGLFNAQGQHIGSSKNHWVFQPALSIGLLLERPKTVE